MKYRIMSNGLNFRVQRKVGFFWLYEKRMTGFEGQSQYVEFTTRAEAEKFIKQQAVAKEYAKAKWRVV